MCGLGLPKVQDYAGVCGPGPSSCQVHVNGFVGVECVASEGLCFVGGGGLGLLKAGNCFAEQLE